MSRFADGFDIRFGFFTFQNLNVADFFRFRFFRFFQIQIFQIFSVLKI